MPERSMSVPGCARRSLIAATRLCPPARSLPFVCASSADALATESAFLCWKLYMRSLLLRLGRPDRVPHPVRRGGHLDILDAAREQRVVHGVHHCRRRADGARFPAAFRTERIVRARRDLG